MSFAHPFTDAQARMRTSSLAVVLILVTTAVWLDPRSADADGGCLHDLAVSAVSAVSSTGNWNRYANDWTGVVYSHSVNAVVYVAAL